ncbi:hypothetical protein P7C70_g7386, partial [Phenoliferia sp. Uapishka_3]
MSENPQDHPPARLPAPKAPVRTSARVAELTDADAKTLATYLYKEALQAIEACLPWFPDAYRTPTSIYTSPAVPTISDLDVALVKRVMETLYGKSGFFADAWQLKIAIGALSGRCQVGLAWTGGGKSCVWILMLLAYQLAKVSKFIVLIGVTKAQQDDQMLSLTALGFDVAALNEDTEKSDPKLRRRFIAGEGDLWTMTPEKMRNDPGIRKCFSDAEWRKKCGAVVFDEFHTFEEWGRTFRPDLQSLWQVQESMGSRMVWIFLSATAPVATTVNTIEGMKLLGRPIDGTDAGCERDEHFYEIYPFQSEKATYADLAILLPPELLPVPRSLESPTGRAPNADNYPLEKLKKSVVFIKTKKGCISALHRYRQTLPDHLRSSATVMYGACSPEMRARIITKFKSGEITTLFCTDAFGLGCDIAGIENVIQYGDADSFLSHEQHGGRGGRGRFAKKCRFRWLTSLETFGPLEAVPVPVPVPKQVTVQAPLSVSTPTLSIIACPTPSTQPIDSPTPTPIPNHPLSGKPPIMTKAALQHRQRLFSKTPTLYRLANPINHECARDVRRDVLRPKLGGYFRSIGGTWERYEYERCELAPEGCCSSSLAGMLERGPPRADGVEGVDEPTSLLGPVCLTDVEKEQYRARFSVKRAWEARVGLVRTRHKQEADAIQALFLHYFPPSTRPPDPKISCSLLSRAALRTALLDTRESVLNGPRGFLFYTKESVISSVVIDLLVAGANVVLGAEELTEEWVGQRFQWMAGPVVRSLFVSTLVNWRVWAGEQAQREKKARLEREKEKRQESAREKSSTSALTSLEVTTPIPTPHPILPTPLPAPPEIPLLSTSSPHSILSTPLRAPAQKRHRGIVGQSSALATSTPTPRRTAVVEKNKENIGRPVRALRPTTKFSNE